MAILKSRNNGAEILRLRREADGQVVLLAYFVKGPIFRKVDGGTWKFHGRRDIGRTLIGLVKKDRVACGWTVEFDGVRHWGRGASW